MAARVHQFDMIPTVDQRMRSGLRRTITSTPMPSPGMTAIRIVLLLMIGRNAQDGERIPKLLSVQCSETVKRQKTESVGRHNVFQGISFAKND